MPVLFGDQRNPTGGFKLFRKMIYQRMYNEGTYEEVRLGFVCGRRRD